MEVSSYGQFIRTNRFLHHSETDSNYLDLYSSNYLYSRIAYGVSANLTLSLESGYWLSKKQIGLNKSDTLTGSGLGDVIIFPRYKAYSHSSENNNTELTLGVGAKIPLGHYHDSTSFVEPFSGTTYSIVNPPVLQPSSGAMDLFGYAFFFRGFPDNNFRIFANALYIHKGWNPLGEKMGDYASLGLFAGKTFFKNSLSVVLQMKGEWIDEMKINETVWLYSFPNYDPEATGSKKVFFTPQLSYTFNKKLTVSCMAEIPVFQFVNRVQIASQLQITTGLAYRFYIKS